MEFLKKCAIYLNIVRPKNLLLVGLTQYIIYYYLFLQYDIRVALSDGLLPLFIMATILIAAGGYIINDILDVASDLVNKPSKSFIPTLISKFHAYIYYYVILTLGFTISIFIAIKTNNLPLISIYPMACGMLYLYSKKFKSSVLIGNVIVSLFVALVSVIIIVAERKLLFGVDPANSTKVALELLIFYSILAFLINLIREIIKDTEDIEGDTQAGYVTLPIKYGVSFAKKTTIGLIVSTNLLLIAWIFTTSINLDFRIKTYLLLLVTSPLSVVLQILTKTTHKRDFSKISTILKWTMLAGLGALILISNIN